MFGYYFKLGVRCLRRSPVLTALMVLTLAVGVAACISTLTILHVMSGNPIPHKSDRLFVPVIDNGSLEGYAKGEPAEDQLTYPDASNFLKSGVGERRTALYGVELSIESGRKDLPSFSSAAVAPTRDFFAMFDVPFLHGQAWSAAEDASGADVVVLSRAIAEKLFGDANPVGRRVTMMGNPYTVVGVIAHWRPLPRYFHMVGTSRFGAIEDFFIPLSNAVRHEMPQTYINCKTQREPGFQATLASECTWLQFWFETGSAAGRLELQNYLDNYASEQRKLGRLKRNAPNQLYDVMEWLDHLQVAGNDSRLSAWLAFGFLVLCLINTVGLLLAKFSARSPEVGVRRALGASRQEIFRQFLTETAVVGLAGGLLGLMLAFGALALIGMQSTEMAAVAHMDWLMLAFTIALSVVAAMLAGLLPSWRACQAMPALQLKSQ